MKTKVLTELDEANSLLQLYTGADAKIALFGISFTKLSILLTSPKHTEVVYILGINCKHIIGDFMWKNAELSIIENKTENGIRITKIVDKVARFELVTTGGFALACGELKYFGNSFEHFFLDKDI